MQAFDAPWPLVQANALYFSSSVLLWSDDQPIFGLYYNQVFTDVLSFLMSLAYSSIVIGKLSSTCENFFLQVFAMLLGKMIRSTDEVVRATCSSSLGLLLKSTKLISWREARLDRLDTARRGHE